MDINRTCKATEQGTNPSSCSAIHMLQDAYNLWPDPLKANRQLSPQSLWQLKTSPKPGLYNNRLPPCAVRTKDIRVRLQCSFSSCCILLRVTSESAWLHLDSNASKADIYRNKRSCWWNSTRMGNHRRYIKPSKIVEKLMHDIFSYNQIMFPHRYYILISDMSSHLPY